MVVCPRFALGRLIRLAKPMEITDIDRTVSLGRELTMEACGVDKGNGKECEGKLHLPKIEFYCEEIDQHNENANGNIPDAHGLLLKGEWLVCVSGETSNSNGDVDVSNTAVEHAYRLSESRETLDAREIRSESCREGMGKSTCIDEVDGNAGCGIGPVDTPNESEMLVTTSIQLEGPDGSGILCVYLGGTRMWMGDVNGCRC